MIKKLLAVGMGVAALCAATACEPFTMRVTVDRKVIVDYGPGDADDFVQMTGTLQCTESEPPDMWFYLRQTDSTGQLVAASLGSAISEPCEPEQHTWTRTWQLQPAFGKPSVRPGEASLEFWAATNPGADDELDRVNINRRVLVLEGQLAS